MNIIDRIRAFSRGKKFEQTMLYLKPDVSDKILEVGVANREHSPVDNFLIKNYPFIQNITALGVGDLSGFKAKYPEIRTISYNGRNFPFRDEEFDIVHSNAVIEHVGRPELQLFFLKEMVRVARKGMLTTPNRYFPIETHTRIPFLHWLGKNKFDKFLKMIGKGRFSGEYMYLLNAKDIVLLADKAELLNYRIIRNRLFGFTMTFSLVWVKDKRQFRQI